MTEQSNQILTSLKILIICIIIPFTQSTNCTHQRCCSLTICTSLYCQQQNSQTWISTQSFSNYQYTKLIIVNNQCKPCAYNCKVCSSQSICTTCYDGYYMDSNYSCMACNYKCLKCLIVNNISKCSLCDTGTYLDTTTSVCKICPMGAQSCVDSTNIIACNAGYLKSSNNLFCTPCSSNCISCPSSTNICSMCTTRYYVLLASCRICNISNCATCVAVGSSVFCSQCNSGYYKVNNTLCRICPLNCQICSSETLCTTCSTGYYINAGGCSSVTTIIPNCSIYSNQTSYGIFKCTTCVSGYYLSTTALQCIPCSITCTSCYGDHFGRCTVCANTSKLFNQMCIPYPYLSSNQLQLYYTAAANGANGNFMGGSSICGSLLYQGVTISLNLNNLAAFQLVINYRLFSEIPGQQFTVSLNSNTTLTSLYSILNSNTSVYTSSTQTTSSLSYQICTSINTTSSYYSRISSLTFNKVLLQNTLTFTSVSSSLNLYISQILVTAYQCSQLCIECSQSQCYTCMTNNLYKQDAYCVYACGNGYYTYKDQMQCVKECPVGTYGLLTNISCMACVPPCQTCLNDKYCLSCTQGFYLSTKTNACLEQCPYRYYASSTTQKCQQCISPCNQCLTDLKCINCQSGFLENNTCVDTCLIGYYQDLTTLRCTPCSNLCLTCAYNMNYCMSCVQGKFLYNNTCVDVCINGFFANLISGRCEACTYPCEKCAGGSSICLSCVDGYLLNDFCYSSCPISYYQQNVLLTCLPCNSDCIQCTGFSTNCLQCSPDYKFLDNKCLSSCPNGYYPQFLITTNITICSKCAGSCQTCLNQTFCLSCNANFLVSNNFGICVRYSLCQKSQYANIVTLKCQACDPLCLTCFYINNFCTACNIGYVLYNHTCLNTCPSQYFYVLALNTSSNSTNQSICNVCQQPCLTCIKQNQCLSCVQGYKYSSSMHLCSSTCSIGQFFNKTINDCQGCSTNCLNCNSPTFCYICNISTYLYFVSLSQNQCIIACPPGYYADTLTCMTCLFPCQLCISSIQCLTCQNGILYQSRCLSGCPQSTYTNIVNNTCQNCQGNCLTCKENTFKCTSCFNGYYLMQSNYTCVNICPSGTYKLILTKSCISCPQECLTCTNSSYCTSCIEGKTYLNPLTHTCVQYCAAGYFGNIVASKCQICAVKCQTCSSATQCLTCSTNYLLIRLINATYDCLTSCPSQHYNDSNTCYKCSFPCKDCLSPSQCKTCAIGTYYHNISKSCLMSCTLGTYSITTSTLQCKDCISPCQTCKNSTNCISCVMGYLLYQGTCVQNCPIKYYADGSGICNRCYGLCQTCLNKYQCITCITGFGYSGYCYSVCPPGTFASQYTNKCQPCQSPCLQCTSMAAYCKKCQYNMFAYRGNCSNNCPVGTYVSGQICYSCQFPCIKCLNQFTCQQCIGGYLLYMRTSCIVNVPKCPNDLYKMNSKQCVPATWCHQNYYTDQYLKTCSIACSFDKYVNKKQRSCMDSCNVGQYVGQNMICKNWNQQQPKSLMMMTVIVFIKSSELHVVIQFNQTMEWLENSQDMFKVADLDNVRRLLLSSSFGTISYTLENSQQLVLQIASMPYSAQISLPAYNLKSTQTNYNLQNPNLTIHIPKFTAYTYQQVYRGSIMKQFSQGISWFIILFSMLFLFINHLSDVYILWDTAQLLYLIVFLDIQYPPNLNQFLLGLSNINFLFIPSMFTDIVGNKRLVSSSPFYAYTQDNSFLRTAGSPLLLVTIVLSIYLLLKLLQILTKNIQPFKLKLNQHLKIKNYIYKGLLRFRWHHTSDIFFVTYDIIVLFAVAQIVNMPQNSNNIASNIICIVIFVIYLAFPCFVSYKLYRHCNNITKGKMVTNLLCFYRGVQKRNKFGISLILIRYFRKLMYGIIIGIFTKQPMFALPILMFTSVLMGCFMFINKPFKKRLSNIINVMAEVSLVIVYIVIALIQFGQHTLSIESKMILGWVCCGVLLIILLALIFEIFCKTMFFLQPQKSSEQGTKTQLNKQLNQKYSEKYIRKKAGQFFDRMLPKLRQNFNLDDSEDTLKQQYQQGDSQNSQNNQQRQKNWGLFSQSQSRHSDQFRHYVGSSDQGCATNQQKQNKAPNYLIRCVKQIQ